MLKLPLLFVNHMVMVGSGKLESLWALNTFLLSRGDHQHKQIVTGLGGTQEVISELAEC